MSAKVVMPDSPSLRVLHVDDDPVNLRVVQDILVAFGHDGHQASDGPQALEQLDRQMFDVVLMDIHMPGMSGYDVVRRLRSAPGPERLTPVIALTADTFAETHKDYASLGFQDFITKPILVSRLCESLIRVTADRQPAYFQRRKA